MGVWKEIISSQQASYVPGRHAIDNVVIFQELIHSLRHKKVKKGGFVIKLDLEEAYDRLDWNFIEETSREASIPAKLILVIMKLVSSSFCRLLWNREQTDNFKQRRGFFRVILCHQLFLFFAWRGLVIGSGRMLLMVDGGGAEGFLGRSSNLSSLHHR